MKKLKDGKWLVLTNYKNMKNNTFNTNKKLVYFLYLLGNEHLTGQEIEDLIKEAEKAEISDVHIQPFTAGNHAKHQADRLINQRKR